MPCMTLENGEISAKPIKRMTDRPLTIIREAIVSAGTVNIYAHGSFFIHTRKKTAYIHRIL